MNVAFEARPLTRVYLPPEAELGTGAGNRHSETLRAVAKALQSCRANRTALGAPWITKTRS